MFVSLSLCIVNSVANRLTRKKTIQDHSPRSHQDRRLPMYHHDPGAQEPRLLAR